MWAAGRESGGRPRELVDASRLRVPVLAHGATQDAALASDTVDQLGAGLTAAGANYTGHRYLAQHAFANETAVGPGRLPITQ